MRVLVFSTVFPNPAQATHGIFVWERIRHTVDKADILVVAPLPWWPLTRRTQVPRSEVREDTSVKHPTFFYVPGILKVLDGLFLFLSTLWCVTRIRRRFKFDLIDAHFAFPDGFAAVLLGLWFGCPVVCTLRGTLIPLSRYRLRRWAMRWSLRRTTRVIAVAQPLAQCAERLGVPKKRISLIGNGVDTSLFVPRSQAESRRNIGLPSEGRLLVSVGHLSERKGFHLAIRALRALLDNFPDLRLAIVGGPGAEGDYGPQLRQQIDELGLQDRILMVGPQKPAQVSQWIAAADLFVLASQYEGCPNVVWEALACGRPVVATTVGDIPRIVPPFAGILYEEANSTEALGRAIATALAREWDHRRIRAYSEDHTWQDVAARVAEVWQRAAQSESSAHVPFELVEAIR